jgi:hypothetical protein
MNNIVARGFGQGSRIVTRGYGTILDAILDAVSEVVKRASGTAKVVTRDLKDKYVTVRATLIEVNRKEIINVSGTDKGNIQELDVTVSAKVLISRVYKTLREIFIRATNIRSNRHRRE